MGGELQAAPVCQDEWLIDFIGRAEPVAVLKLLISTEK
jgi:hypothetical protein